MTSKKRQDLRIQLQKRARRRAEKKVEYLEDDKNWKEVCQTELTATYCVKLKFHWDQFPRNFPVANVTGKSPTSYEEVGRVASLLRGSYEETGDFQTISTCQDGLATSPTSPRGSYGETGPSGILALLNTYQLWA